MSEHTDPKKTPLVAQRLLLLEEMFEGRGRGASVTELRDYTPLRSRPEDQQHDP
jgi:hypothetical protein